MATNSDLIASQAAHAGFINRVGKGNANKVIKFLKEADSYIAGRLSSEGETIRNQLRLLAVQRDVRKKLNLIYTKWEKLRDQDIQDLGPYEALFQSRLIGKFADDSAFTLPSNEQLFKAATAQPLAIGRLNSSVSFTSMLADWKPSQIATTNAVITNGFALGQTTGQISKRIRNEVMPLSRRNSDAVVITATNHMSNTAKIQTYKENDDIVIGYRLIATLDARTTTQCKSWDQTVVLNGDDFQPAPPFHWRACVGGTDIHTIQGEDKIENIKVGDLVKTHTGSFKKVTAVMAKQCDSKCVRLVNNFGKSVLLTDDHPVLTDSGWKCAGEIKSGDKVFNYSHHLAWFKNRFFGSIVENSALINAHNIKTKVTERLVAYSVTSFATGVSSSIKLKQSVTKRKIRNKVSAYLLKFKGAINALKE